mmetsp:Transcript_40192/g.70728  ORF Transcript_40192/g.70728 Transcript_40192/m.70728 type:complete len:80 (+) Transcript_40192:35-274(+)
MIYYLLKTILMSGMDAQTLITKHSSIIVESSMDVHILALNSNDPWGLPKTFSEVNPLHLPTIPPATQSAFAPNSRSTCI